MKHMVTLAYLFDFLLLTFLATQIVAPILMNRPLFPLFRRSVRQAQRRHHDALVLKEEAELNKETETLMKTVSKNLAKK
jgi:hypothetical protein